MSAIESLDPDRSLWDLIAVELRRQCEAHRISGSRLGAMIGCDRSTVSRYETGTLKLGERQAKILDREWALEGLFTRLVRYARAGHNADWFQQNVAYEARATVVKIFEQAVIPGPLQTQEYARALFTAGRAEDIDAAVETRIARQVLLTKPRPPVVWILLDETVLLRTFIGGPEVVRGQLAHLLKVSEFPHVTIRIVPLSVGAHVGIAGSFRILTVREGDVAFMEARGGGRLVLDATEVRRFGIEYDQIGAEALSRDSSRSLLASILESIE
jgi:transcriptional regulator with XRE-family HTH domain